MGVAEGSIMMLLLSSLAPDRVNDYIHQVYRWLLRWRTSAPVVEILELLDGVVPLVRALAFSAFEGHCSQVVEALALSMLIPQIVWLFVLLLLIID
jgi:hypothetical protein